MDSNIGFGGVSKPGVPSSGSGQPAQSSPARPARKVWMFLFVLAVIAGVGAGAWAYWQNSLVVNQKADGTEQAVLMVQGGQIVFPKTVRMAPIEAPQAPQEVRNLAVGRAAQVEMKTVRYEALQTGYWMKYTVPKTTVSKVKEEVVASFLGAEGNRNVWRLLQAVQSGPAAVAEFALKSDPKIQSRAVIMQQDSDVKVVIQIVGDLK